MKPQTGQPKSTAPTRCSCGTKSSPKKQPDWLRNLSPAQETIFNHLESKEEKSTAKLASLMEKIPSLSSFSRTKMNGAIKDAYPLTNMDADQLKVKVVTQTRFHLGRSGIPQPLQPQRPTCH